MCKILILYKEYRIFIAKIQAQQAMGFLDQVDTRIAQTPHTSTTLLLRRGWAAGHITVALVSQIH